jgi:glycosyltransferase involved in cell wall biosynthesis
MKNPKVSVIIPVYNGEKYLQETIESVLNQTYQDFEIIIVDDASTDGSPEIIKSFIKKYPDKIKVFWHKKNKGCPAATKNTGIKHAKGDFIAFLDQDDVWYPDKLKKQVNILEKEQKIIANFANTDIFDESRQKIIGKKWSFIPPFPPQRLLRIRLLQGNFIQSTSSAIAKKEILNKIGGFDEKMKMTDDYELWLRLSHFGQISFLRQLLLFWRLRRSSLSHSEVAHIKDLEYFTNKLMKLINTEEEKEIAQKKILIYKIRLANYYLDLGNYQDARSIYKSVLKNNDQKMVRLILTIMLIRSKNCAINC